MAQERTRKTPHWTRLALALALAAGCSKSKPAVEEPTLPAADGAAGGRASSSTEAAPAPVPAPAPEPVPDQGPGGEESTVRTDSLAKAAVQQLIERLPPLSPDPLESAAILARPAVKGEVQVLHVILGWKDTPVALRSTVDPRALQRTKAETDKLAAEVLAKVRKGASMTKLMKELSEDPESSVSGAPYLVDESSPYVEPFKNLALRLKLNEAGLVRTDFGWHIIKRVPPPPLDKLESKQILARKQVADHAAVKHILLGWTAVHADDPRGKERTRAELEALVKKTVAALKKGAAIEPLMKELSEDPGSSATGESYIASPQAGLVKPFKNLALRLEVGEIGVVKTIFGIHILKRVPDAAPAAGPTLP